MTQRVLIGAVLVLTALLVVGGWSMTSTLSAVVEQNQKATAAILERMGKEPPAAVASSPEWVAVKYRLVQGTTDGPPVVGQQVSLQQQSSAGASRLNQISEVTNSEGVADFGLLPYGTYGVSISTPAGIMGEGITVRPGRPIDTKIVVPNSTKMVHVKFEYTPPDMTNWKWNDDVPMEEKLAPCLCIQYRPLHATKIDGKVWSSPASSGTVIVGPKGMFNVKNGSAQERIIASSEAVESIAVPAIEMEIQAEWYLSMGNSVDGVGLPGKDAFYRPAALGLDNAFVSENRKSAESTPDSMPVVLNLKSTPEPQVISLPSNRPGFIDGTGISFEWFQGFNP